MNTPSAYVCCAHLIFDLHRTILHCRLEETLGSTGWQHERELAVEVLREAAGTQQCDDDEHCSSAPLFPPEKPHGEGILKHGYLSSAIAVASLSSAVQLLRLLDWTEDR